MAEWVKPGGALLTLQFPLGHYGTAHPVGQPLDYTRGPPYLLTPQLYHELLDSAFVLEERLHLPPELAESSKRPGGVEAIALWRRRA